MRKNFDQSVKINHNPNWPYISDHPELNKTSTTRYWQNLFVSQRSI